MLLFFVFTPLNQRIICYNRKREFPDVVAKVRVLEVLNLLSCSAVSSAGGPYFGEFYCIVVKLDVIPVIVLRSVQSTNKRFLVILPLAEGNLYQITNEILAFRSTRGIKINIYPKPKGIRISKLISERRRGPFLRSNLAGIRCPGL